MIETRFTLKNPRRRSAKALVEAGHYDHVNHLVRQAKLAVDQQRVGDYEVVLIGAEPGVHCVTSNDALAAASRARLDRPTYLDGLLFGEQFPEEHARGPIVLLHNPMYIWSGISFYLALTVEGGTRGKPRRRILSSVSSGGLWQSNYRFLFVHRLKNES